VYLLILHGQIREQLEGKEIRSSFLQVAIPDAELNKYRRVYDVRNLLQAYAQQEAAASVNVRTADRAVPTVRKKESK